MPDSRCLAVAVVFVDADEGYVRVGGGHPLEGKTDDGGRVVTDAIFVAIPGSSNPAHIAENHDIFDFELTDDEMNRIASLNRNEKHDWY